MTDKVNTSHRSKRKRIQGTSHPETWPLDGIHPFLSPLSQMTKETAKAKMVTHFHTSRVDSPNKDSMIPISFTTGLSKPCNPISKNHKGNGEKSVGTQLLADQTRNTFRRNASSILELLRFNSSKPRSLSRPDTH
ncbi:MAG: hypothetical protein BWY82_00013 [Verrucomicrobia bacterium ADurb.Bin474]|nr:MAG: hypothetical protein BWY82_00013 [Verrucomicrobia bacterium ADurb.Bin474]